MTKTNVTFKPVHIQFQMEEASIAETNSFHLFADINKPIAIEPGRFALVPTSVHLGGGDGNTLGLIEIYAGRNEADETAPVTGSFIIPPQHGENRVDVPVYNMTPATILIQPKVSVGVLTFRMLAEPEHDDLRKGGHTIDIRAVYTPEHIDADTKPAYATPGSSGIDLRADLEKEHVLAPGERMLVPTGLRMAIPQGLEGQIRPRSGLSLRNGVAAIFGTIDADYRGEIKIVLKNGGNEPFTVVPGERVAQFVIAPIVQGALAFGAELDETSRGEGGFGSTGR